MTHLPLREMVLYKHGVGFFRREGEFDASAITLTFRHDAINDVLKSLAAFDRAGGQVLGIHYPTPIDKAARLADSAIRLSDNASLFDLLRDLRGREVTLSVSGTSERGRVIGLDIAQGAEMGPRDALVSLASGQDAVRIFRLGEIAGVQIHDERAEHDLHYFLDTSMSEDLRRTVSVRLSEGHHELVVYYIAPSPTWRVSYRLIGEIGENASQGRALLQGWGLFDNRMDEDLEEVAVTLVAGQPISFIYNLYASHIPKRPVVEDEARVAPGPVEYRAEKLMQNVRPMRSGGVSEDRLMAAAGRALMAAPARMMDLDEMEESLPAAAEGRESGEFFQYVVTAPVSVRRGESAMVPILSAQVQYERELLYNRSKLPDHPVAALRLVNSTGLTLERGPITVVENSEYRGEAIVPFTRADAGLYLPYAVELGVQITELEEHRTEMAGLSLREAYLIVEEWQVRSVTYRIDNSTSQDQIITLEATIQPGWEPFGMDEPAASTASERRWRVVAPAHSLTQFIRQERHRTYRHEEVRQLDYRRLQSFLEGRWLDRATFDRLSEVLDYLGRIQNAQAEQSALDKESQQIAQRQAQIRENLGALKTTGDEAQLRSRMLRQLEASEDRLEAIGARRGELAQQIADAEARISALLAALGRDKSRRRRSP